MARVVHVYSMWLLNKPLLLLCVDSDEGKKWYLNPIKRISSEYYIFLGFVVAES